MLRSIEGWEEGFGRLRYSFIYIPIFIASWFSQSSVGSEGKSAQMNEKCFPLPKVWVGDLSKLVFLKLPEQPWNWHKRIRGGCRGAIEMEILFSGLLSVICFTDLRLSKVSSDQRREKRLNTLNPRLSSSWWAAGDH